MNYLARLHALKAEKCAIRELTEPTKPRFFDPPKGFDSFGSYSDAPISEKCDVPANPAAWCTALARLDATRPPAGIALAWWQTVLADALWIARNHGEAASAFGWSASDLFGIMPQLGPTNGGLADRLDGARRLAFTARVAHWQGDDLDGWLWRRTLTVKPLLWEV